MPEGLLSSLSAERRGLTGLCRCRTVPITVRRASEFSGAERQTDQTGNHQPTVAWQKTQGLHYRLSHGILRPNTAPFRGGVCTQPTLTGVMFIWV